MTRRITRVAGLLIAVVLCACSSTKQTRYMHKNADLGALQKVAVLPFESLSSDRTAADKVQKIFYIELLALDVFEVAEPGEVNRLTRSTAIETLGPTEMKQLGKQLGVDAFFVGSVLDFAESHTGTTSSPEITIQMRMIETQTGSTVWSTSQSRSGATIGKRLFGVGGESLTEAARRVVRAELATLLK